VARRGVGILADDENTDVVQGLAERAQDVLSRRRPWALGCVFSAQELTDRGEVVLLCGEVGNPGLVHEFFELLRHVLTLARETWGLDREGGVYCHDAAMRITVDIDDEVLAAARVLSGESGISLGAAVSELARRGLRPRNVTKDFPMFDVSPDAPAMTPESVRDVLNA